MDAVFKALADPNRRLLLDKLRERNGQTLRELGAGLEMTRQSVSKHLDVLEAADLVISARRGREKVHFLNAAPITAINDRWIGKYDQHRARTLADLKNVLEQKPMNENAFVYVTYIRTTPEQLWQGLTDPAFTRQYWGLEFDSEWTTGATMTWLDRGATIRDSEQKVLAYEPYHRLAYSWHTFTPEWAGCNGISEEYRAKAAAEQRSRVSFELEPQGEMVKLTVVHDGFPDDSVVLPSVSQGWPELLASLKTLLETGKPLPMD